MHAWMTKLFTQFITKLITYTLTFELHQYQMTDIHQNSQPLHSRSHRAIFNTNIIIPSQQQQQQGFRQQIVQSEQRQQNQSFFKRVSNFFHNFNLCLRPQIQSHQLMSFLQNYEVDSLYQDPYYGECYALRLRQVDKQSLNLRSSIFNSSRQKQHFQRVASLRHYISLSKQRLSKRQYRLRKQTLDQMSRYSGSQQNVLRFTIISQLQKQQFIFTNMQLYIAYDFILIDLQKQFQNRIMQRRAFTQSQINIIMKQVCSGLVALQNANYKSIRMSYVYFCQYGKQIKVAHPKLFQYKSNLQTIAHNHQLKGIYLSPQQLQLLQKNQIDSNRLVNQMPNAFTFGMMVLSLMCNSYLNSVYDYRTCEINFIQVQQLVNNLASQFSQRLVNIVTKLLKPKLHQRLTLRSLMNVLQEKYQLTEHVEITLIKEHVTQQISQADKFSQYRPLFEQQPEQPRHKNYLYGMVYPKIGTQAEYYHYDDNSDPFRRKSVNDDNFLMMDNNNVIANHRYSYLEPTGELKSKYLGDAVIRTQLREEPLKEGLGLYILPDGQSYQGEWKNNQMHGNGKLYYPQKKIRYEGQFQKGFFDGFGTQYSYEQIPQREQQIDKTFVRLHKGSWLKYEGRFKKDKREGPGKAYFKNGIWIGNFKNGQPNGHGIWEGNNGEKLKGIWEDGCYRQPA